MPAQLRIHTEDDPDQVLSIARPRSGHEGINSTSVTIEANGLSCSRGALLYGDNGIRAFFAGLAADWAGWPGTRSWESLEGELTIEASHTGRRIELTCTLRGSIAPDAWRVTVVMSLLPDESLDRLAADVEELFGNL